MRMKLFMKHDYIISNIILILCACRDQKVYSYLNRINYAMSQLTNNCRLQRLCSVAINVPLLLSYIIFH